MSPKHIHNLSGDEIRKECIRFGLSGRFTMKEALVELTTTLVRRNLDPKIYQFYSSQPLQRHFPYQVVILTDIVETMKPLPASMVTCPLPSVSAASPLPVSSAPFTGVNASSVPFFNPDYPPPKPSVVNVSGGLDTRC